MIRNFFSHFFQDSSFEYKPKNETKIFIEESTARTCSNNNEQNCNVLSGKNLTEVDENEFFYEEDHRYMIDNETIPGKENAFTVSSYTVDELIDEDETDDEEDHVKILEQTIANLSRNLPPFALENDLTTVKTPSNTVFDVEIESSSNTPECSSSLTLSRSSAIRENLTDFLNESTICPSNPPLQRTLSIQDKVKTNSFLTISARFNDEKNRLFTN